MAVDTDIQRLTTQVESEMTSSPIAAVKKMRYRDSKLFKAGAIMLALGTGPLVAIIAAASLGLTKDPNPNPIGPGLLSFLTFWPSVIMMALGIGTVKRMNRTR
jgi:hypothetical protein